MPNRFVSTIVKHPVCALLLTVNCLKELHQFTIIKQGLLLRVYTIYLEWKDLRVSFLWCILCQVWNRWKFWSLWSFSSRNMFFSLARIPVDSSLTYLFHISVILYIVPHLSVQCLSTFLVINLNTFSVNKHAFHHCFFVFSLWFGINFCLMVQVIAFCHFTSLETYFFVDVCEQ